MGWQGVWEPFFLSLRLAGTTACALFFLCLPCAYYLAYKKGKVSYFLGAVSILPIVLPPSVLGFYLLVFFSALGQGGKISIGSLSFEFLFSFLSLLIASIIRSFPLMLEALKKRF